MNTTLFLKDETAHAGLLLQNAGPAKVTLEDAEAVAGCNCDRWGHPCPSCDEREVQMKAQVPISSPAKSMKEKWNT